LMEQERHLSIESLDKSPKQEQNSGQETAPETASGEVGEAELSAEEQDSFEKAQYFIENQITPEGIRLREKVRKTMETVKNWGTGRRLVNGAGWFLSGSALAFNLVMAPVSKAEAQYLPRATEEVIFSGGGYPQEGVETSGGGLDPMEILLGAGGFAKDLSRGKGNSYEAAMRTISRNRQIRHQTAQQAMRERVRRQTQEIRGRTIENVSETRTLGKMGMPPRGYEGNVSTKPLKEGGGQTRMSSIEIPAGEMNWPEYNKGSSDGWAVRKAGKPFPADFEAQSPSYRKGLADALNSE
ncbi:MAG: hypothetical protein HY001_01635, partial [Candidatus Portnoybacteria bacterium]|nr:hypothetical protein [Candidatus Portnoybacteria bacterium]